jgi:hypothetical protein
MKPIELNEIKDLVAYEKIRKQSREHVIEIKKLRRISVGPNLTFVFENRETVLFQIQEMARTERLVHDEAIQYEIDVYNQLVPGDHEISATLLIEITDKAQIKPILDSLIGLGYNSVFFRIGDHEITTQFDEGQAAEDRISAVQYLKWKLSDDDVQALRSPHTLAQLIVRHRNYDFATTLTEDQREALLEDLAESI